MKTARQLTFALLIAIVCIVLIGAIMLLNDPSGRVLQLSSDDVRGRFMNDFTPFAWLLIFTAGLIGLIAVIFIFYRIKYFPALIIIEGIILLLWCIAFISFISDSTLIILVFGLFGAAFILLGRFIQKQRKEVVQHHVAFNESKQTHSSSHSHQKSHYHKHRKRGH